MCRKPGIGRWTFYQWRKEYGGLRIDQARQSKDLEKEDAQPKKLVADLSLDTSSLRKRPRETCEPGKASQGHSTIS